MYFYLIIFELFMNIVPSIDCTFDNHSCGYKFYGQLNHPLEWAIHEDLVDGQSTYNKRKKILKFFLLSCIFQFLQIKYCILEEFIQSYQFLE